MPTDEEIRDTIGKLVSGIADARRSELEFLDEFLNKLSKPRAESPRLSIPNFPEKTFNLKFEPCGELNKKPFENALKTDNPEVSYTSAIKVLIRTQSDSSNKRFCGKNNDFNFSYWTEHGVVFRQKRKAEKKPTTPKRTDSLFSYPIIGIKWEKSETQSGKPSIKAMAFQNENNPAYQALSETLLALDNKKRYPFWITRDYIGRQRPRNWK